MSQPFTSFWVLKLKVTSGRKNQSTICSKTHRLEIQLKRSTELTNKSICPLKLAIYGKKLKLISTNYKQGTIEFRGKKHMIFTQFFFQHPEWTFSSFSIRGCIHKIFTGAYNILHVRIARKVDMCIHWPQSDHCWNNSLLLTLILADCPSASTSLTTPRHFGNPQ